MAIDDLALETIRVSRDGHIISLVIDRADSDINAVNGVLHTELALAFQALKGETEARAIVLTGNGRAFSAGGDFKWFPDMQDTAELYRMMLEAKHLVWDMLDIEIPIVAAVNGHAIGLGATIALLCDIIIMADDALIGDPHVRVGIVAGDGGVALWPMAVGLARAKEYLLTGDSIAAEDALAMGLVNRVVPEDEVLASALAMAERLANIAPLAVRFTKRSINKLIKNAVNIAFDTSTALEMMTFLTEDHREAMLALQERRAAIYQGR